MARLRIGVLISGSGTNLQAIIDRIASGGLDAEIAVVLSNKPGAYGLQRAREVGVPAVVVDPAGFDGPAAYNAALAGALVDAGAQLVVMAGYMRLLGSEVLEAFPDRVINLHPSLLPSFVGEHGIQDAFAYGVKVTGVTVHFADGAYDTGAIIAQRPVAVEDGDTVETLEAKIHAVEHELLPEVIGMIAEGRVSREGRRVRVAPKG